MTTFNPMYMISRRPPPIETVGGTTTVGKYVISDDTQLDKFLAAFAVANPL
jgi:hypothetical protein